MKNIILLFLSFNLLIAPFLNVTFAQEPPEPPQTIPIIGDCLNRTDMVDRFSCLAGAIARILAFVAFIFAIVQFFLAGWAFLTQGENKEAVQKAQSKLIFAAVGLAVAILSYAIAIAISRLLSA